MAGQPIITLQDVEDLKAKGMNQSDIAREFGVTRAYISYIVHTYGGKLTPRAQVQRDHFPWKVSTNFQRSAIDKNLRRHAEWVVTGGEGMSDDALARVESFHRRLRDYNLVVEFDPDIPPNRDSSVGGYRYADRLPEDGDLMLRVNDNTRLTDEGRNKIWKLPPASATY